MAGHLLGAGYPLTVYTRTRQKADSLCEAGASWAPSVAVVARSSDVVISIVGFPADVESVYLGPGGVVEQARPGALLIDMTTSAPQLAAKIEAVAKSRGLSALDAPVSGGDVGAREARLSIMVGGEQAAFEAALPLLEVLGTTIVHQGPAGAGQFCKMANQIAIASTMVGVNEAMAFAIKAGLDPHTVLQSIESGAAGSFSLSKLIPRALQGDYSPGFFVKHFIKDMAIALEAADQLKLQLPGLSLAKSLYEALAQQGCTEAGTQALFKTYVDQVAGGQPTSQADNSVPGQGSP